MPENKRFFVTGPEIEVGVGAQQIAVTHEEAGVIVAYHMILLHVTD